MKYAPTVVTTLFLLTVLAFYAAAQNVSDEARRHFDRGMAAVEMAKSPDDLNDAIAEFKQATVLAPDWADAFFNLGKVQEAAEKYNDAIVSFKAYISLAPNANDADAIKTLINKLEFKAESILSVEDITKVLTSFASSDLWEKSKGECVGQPFAFIRSKDIGSVEFPTLYGISWGADTRSFRIAKVESPIFKMSGIGMFCGSGNRAAYCHFSSDFEIRVESRTHVRILQKVTQTELSIDRPPAQNGYYSCEYRKKVS